MKDRSIMLLKNNTGLYLHGHEVGKDLSHRTQRSLTTRKSKNTSALHCVMHNEIIKNK